MTQRRRKLTQKQITVRDMVLADCSLDRMEEILGIQRSGVAYHLTIVLKHYGVRNRAALKELVATGQHPGARPKPAVKLRKATPLPVGVCT